MEEDANSWLRRAKYSKTVCHRMDTARFPSIPLISLRDDFGSMKSRPGTASSSLQPAPTISQIPLIPPSKIKPRSISPVPATPLSDSFKEAQSDRKRFSTPNPRRRKEEKENVGEVIDKDSLDFSKHESMERSSIIPFGLLRRVKTHDHGKARKESSWSKYFDYGGGKVISVETSDQWTVDLSKLFLGHKFAHGAHSQLHHGKYKGEPVAVKMIRVPDDDENGALAAMLEKQFTREVVLLSRLHHENIIKFVGAYMKPSVFCIITEYLPGGSLRAYLHKLEGNSLSLQKLIAVALDIARGMQYIHSQGVIHRDLKPENVLITQDEHMKIADFGIACEEAYCDLLVGDPGTYRWMAPEMIKRKSYGPKVDVYSFGLILWEMVAGTSPFKDIHPIAAAYAVMNKNLRPAIPESCPPALGALIEQCWCFKPEKRPEFWQVVKVLEQFQSSLSRDGTIDLVQNPPCPDHEKRLRRWIQKLGSHVS